MSDLKQNKILQNLSSDNSDILEQSLKITKELLISEQKRGDVAEKRTSIVFSLLTILSGAMFYFADKFNSVNGFSDITLRHFLFISAIILLLKSGFYALKTLRIKVYYRLDENLVYDIQKFDTHNAIKHEISWRIWVLNKALQPNNFKLYFYSRSQNNMLICICYICVLSLTYLFNGANWNMTHSVQTYVLTIIIPLPALFLDTILAHYSIWSYK